MTESKVGVAEGPGGLGLWLEKVRANKAWPGLETIFPKCTSTPNLMR